jgi:penicillin G amidase
MRKLGRLLGRILLVLLIILLVVAVGAGGFGLYTVRRVLPTHAGEITLAGLSGEVQIYRDALGIAHIYANTPEDLFFGQGFVHAQDRWWQMEFSRHVGMGRIGELTGFNQTSLNSDIYIRTMGWNRAAEANLQALSAETLTVMQAYSNGINGHLEGKTGPDLALEYSLLAVTGVSIPITPWQPLHSLGWMEALTWDLSGDFGTEIDKVYLRHLHGDQAEPIIEAMKPPYPEDVRPTIIGADELPSLGEAALAPNVKVAAPALDWANIATVLRGVPSNAVKGASNSWVVSGKYTSTGKPLLANDPHLGATAPSSFYQMGLHCNTASAACPYDVVGFSVVGAPGILIGHNQKIAWGLTTPAVDSQDLYAIELSSSDQNAYLVDGEALPISTVTEVIAFGDGTPSQNIEVRLTRFGPIITDNEVTVQRKQPLALRYAAYEQPHDLMAAVLKLNQAQNWDEFRAALSLWNAPSQNFIYADTEGNIGYQLPGLLPIRAATHLGTEVADGSNTKSDWLGYVPFDLMPSVYNPIKGYIKTANESVVPLAYNAWLAEQLKPTYGEVSVYVDDNAAYGQRALRIDQQLQELIAAGKISINQMISLQSDVQIIDAATIIAALKGIDFADTLPAGLFDWFAGWDGKATAESGQTLLYEAFTLALANALWGDEYDANVFPDTQITWSMVKLLQTPDHMGWDNTTTPDVRETRDDILRAAFLTAWQNASNRAGTNYQQWRWADHHRITFRPNPLGVSGIGPIEALVNTGPVEVAGANNTVFMMGWRSRNNFNASHIAVLRTIVDLSDLSNSQWVNSTGQSGHIASPNYRDQIAVWAVGGYYPMASSESAIRRAIAVKLTLKPKP